jgi:hypothetical protein
MAQGPVLLFDKSAIQTLTPDEAAMLDNFYVSNIPPVFLVECLADLERDRRLMKSTPEQLVGALADKTPDAQVTPNVFHLDILKAELSGQIDLDLILLRPLRPKGKEIQLGDQRGVIFDPGPETVALQRWSRREFLEAEREHAKQWRAALSQLDLAAMSEQVRTAIGPWRRPRTLEDARILTDTIIDNLDPEFLLRFGIALLGVPEAVEYVVKTWIEGRRKPLRVTYPYFIHMLSINIFFSLVYPTELLKNVKASHHVDLAYLYYLPFCTVFSSRDTFHVKVAPLFMTTAQTFVHGDDLKAELGRLDAHYKGFPDEERTKGLWVYAQYPPDDSSFLTSRLWDLYLPFWRQNSPNRSEVPAEKRAALDKLMATFRDKTVNIEPGSMPGFDDHSFMEINVKAKYVKGTHVRLVPAPDDSPQ